MQMMCRFHLQYLSDLWRHASVTYSSSSRPASVQTVMERTLKARYASELSCSCSVVSWSGNNLSAAAPLGASFLLSSSYRRPAADAFSCVDSVVLVITGAVPLDDVYSQSPGWEVRLVCSAGGHSSSALLLHGWCSTDHALWTNIDCGNRWLLAGATVVIDDWSNFRLHLVSLGNVDWWKAKRLLRFIWLYSKQLWSSHYSFLVASVRVEVCGKIYTPFPTKRNNNFIKFWPIFEILPISQ